MVIGLFKGTARFLHGFAGRQLQVAGDQLTPAHWHEMGRKADRHLFKPGGFFQLLLNFRCMAVFAYRIGAEPFARLTKQEVLFQAATCARDAGFGVENDLLRLYLPFTDKGDEGHKRGGWVTARAGDNPCRSDIFPVMFCKAIGRLFEEVFLIMAAIVPGFISIRISQAKVR